MLAECKTTQDITVCTQLYEAARQVTIMLYTRCVIMISAPFSVLFSSCLIRCYLKIVQILVYSLVSTKATLESTLWKVKGVALHTGGLIHWNSAWLWCLRRKSKWYVGTGIQSSQIVPGKLGALYQVITLDGFPSIYRQSAGPCRSQL